MGYRSTVGMAIPTYDLNSLLQEKNDPVLTDLVNEMRKLITDYNGISMSFLYHPWIKWDRAYEHVRAIQDLLCSLNGGDYALIEVGEEGNVEIKGSPGNFDMGTSITIDMPCKA